MRVSKRCKILGWTIPLKLLLDILYIFPQSDHSGILVLMLDYIRLACSGGLSQLSDEVESDTDFHSSEQIKHKSSLSAERGNDTVRGDAEVICKSKKEKLSTKRRPREHGESTER